jgi:peroxiredoxin/outer membrane lipoprotein-sorting protein
MRSPLILVVILLSFAIPASRLTADSVVEEQPKVAVEPTPVEKEEAKGKETERPTARVSDEAKALLEKVSAAYQRLKSLELSGKVTLATDDGSQQRTHEATFESAFAAPNRFRHQVKDQPVLGSTGEKVYGYSASENVYLMEEAAKEKVALGDLPREQAALLRAQNPSLVMAVSKDPAAELKEDVEEIAAGEAEEIDGKTYPALKLTVDGGERMTVLIDPETHLIRRASTDLRAVLAKQGRDGMKTALYTVDYTTVKPDVALAEERFAWSPPAGARDLAKMASARRQAGGGADGGGGEKSPLVGSEAPDFTLDAMDGKPVTLSDMKGSVVVLDFWATWCGPCVMAMPHLDKVYKDMKEDGLKVYAVNLREGPEKVKNFMETKGLSLPVLYDKEGEVAKQYGVQGIPTQVIIGKDGTVKKVIVGYDPNGDETLRALLAEEMGAK